MSNRDEDQLNDSVGEFGNENKANFNQLSRHENSEKFLPHGAGTVEMAIDSMDNTGLNSALELWNTWRGNRVAPSWRDIDLSKIPAPLIPLAAVVDVLSGGQDFKYRFWGSGLTRLFGRDETGNLLSSHAVVSSFQVRNHQFLNVVENQRPMLYVTSFEKAKRLYANKTNLRLPIMDTPDAVTKILSLSIIERFDMNKYDDLHAFWCNEKLHMV